MPRSKPNRIYAFFVRCWFTAKMALNGVLSNTLRSALTILGVAVGVASVVGLMGIGEGARQNVIEQFESLGTNVISIKANQADFEFKPEKAEELVERVKGLEIATPVVQTYTTMKWRRDRSGVDVLGVNENLPAIRDHNLIEGQFFTKLHVEQRSYVAVLGYNVATNLVGGRTPIGQTITLDGQSYRILGVLEPKGKDKAENIDDKVIIPYTTAQRIDKKRTVEEIWGKTNSAKDAELATIQLGRIFKKELASSHITPIQSQPAPGEMVEETIDMTGGMSPGINEQDGNNKDKNPEPAGKEEGMTITNLNQLVDELDQANRIMTLLLGGIAAVSLLVGGLGIMNIMLVAVTERTSEIGVRRALGAKQIDLLAQFLLEALYVSIIGVVAGTAAGIWGLSIFANYGFQTAVSLEAIRIAAMVALGAGLLFGIYPAISASSLPPVEALRRN
jgi:putative ABC transport system permease protein